MILFWLLLSVETDIGEIFYDPISAWNQLLDVWLYIFHFYDILVYQSPEPPVWAIRWELIYVECYRTI